MTTKTKPVLTSKQKETEELIERLESLIAHANGADEMVKTSQFCRWIFHTDNMDAVIKTAKAYWLLDVVISHIPNIIRKNGNRAAFQVWRVKVKKNKEARVWCEDGDGKRLAGQIIPFTDFPLKSFEFLVEKGSLDGKNTAYIIMLPGDR